MSDPSDAAVRAWINLNRSQRLVYGAIEADLKAAGLPSLTWYDAIWELEKAGAPLRPFELQERLLFTQYNLSRLVDRLQRQGYVEKTRCPKDRRGHFLNVTDSGLALRQRMWAVYRQGIQRHLGIRLDDEQAWRLAGDLKPLIDPP